MSTKTFAYSGDAQSWTVPADGDYTFTLYGAQGGGDSGGKGGKTTGTVHLAKDTVVHVYVGGAGTDSAAGYNGGGGGFSGFGAAFGGGGASDIRTGGTDLSDRLLVAGGGGGASSSNAGGDGGGTTGGDGTGNNAGEGGTQSSGGSGGSYDGELGQGGDGGYGGGSGGGGYYGGGGGVVAGGGGGGSGYLGSATNASTTKGLREGNGEVTAEWVATVPVTATASAQWHVRQSLTAATDTRWHVRQSLTTTTRTDWTVRTSLNTAAILRWDVEPVGVETSATASWSVRAYLTAAEGASWDTRASLVSQASSEWDVRESITTTASSTWSIRTPLTSDATLSWDVQAPATIATATVTWDYEIRGADVGWRYHAQLLPSGAWVSHDVALSGVELTWDLSGPSAMTATLARGYASELDVLDPWGVAIYAENAGQIRWGGIVTGVDYAPDKASIHCEGFAAYPKGMVWDSTYVGPDDGVDPLDVLRLIWSTLQSQPDGNLGVAVQSTTSPVLLGEPGVGAIALVADELQDHLQAGGSISKDFTYPGESESSRRSSKLISADYHDDHDSLGSTDDLIDYLGKIAAGYTKPRTDGPYALHWWDHKDCGSEIDQLATETPFDYRESHTWTTSGVRHFVELGYPSVGKRRHDLRFVLGENLSSVPQLQANDDYANQVIALGAGEGAKMVRSHVGQRDGRLRRTAVVTDKDVQSRRRLTADARRQLDRSLHLTTLDEVEVLDHPNAPLASIDLGDEVRIRADLGWTDTDSWHRITSMAMKPESADAMTLQLEEV